MSESGSVFNAQIKGIDAASGPIRKIVEAMRGLTSATKGQAEATKHLTAATKDGEKAHNRWLASVGAHVKVLHGHIGTLTAGIYSIRNSITELLPAMAALGAGATIAGLFELTHAASEAQVQLEAMAQQAGVTVAQFVGFSYAAKVSGLPVETMTTGLERLNRTMGMTAIGKNKDAAKLFHHLGIALKDSQGHIRSAADMLPDLAEAFSKTRDPAMRAAMANILFGRAGQQLLPILNQGAGALREFIREGQKLAYVASPEQAKSMREFADNWIGLETSISGFKTEVGATLAPILAPVVAMAKEWVAANRHWIAQAIADKVKLLADALKNLDLKDVIEKTTEWFHSGSVLLDHLGGLRVVLGALTLTLGSPLISAVAGAISIFGGLGRVLMSLTAIMWANPILAAVGAVALAGFLLYENWDWVKQKMVAIFDWFGGQTAWAVGLRAALGPIIMLPVEIYESWGSLQTWFSALFDGVKAVFDGFWSYIKPIVDKIAGALSVFNVPHLPAASLAPAGAAPVMPEMGGMAFPQSPSGQRNYNEDRLPDLYREGGPLRGAAAQQPITGNIGVKVDFANVPPGTKVTTTSSGAAKIDRTDVGYMSPMPPD